MNLYPSNTDFKIIEIDKEEIFDETSKKSYLFDFNKGDFVKNPDGSLVVCDEEMAYKQWVQKVLVTPRFKKMAYSDYYGVELGEILKQELPKGAVELEIKRMVREALKVHPKTLLIDNFTFDWLSEKTALIYTFEVTSAKKERFEIEYRVKY